MTKVFRAMISFYLLPPLCRNCLDYDLCGACEKVSDILHPSTHVFVKIQRPVVCAGYTKKGKLKPLLRNNLYGDSYTFSLPRYVRKTGESAKDTYLKNRTEERFRSAILLLLLLGTLIKQSQIQVCVLVIDIVQGG